LVSIVNYNEMQETRMPQRVLTRFFRVMTRRGASLFCAGNGIGGADRRRDDRPCDRSIDQGRASIMFISQPQLLRRHDQLEDDYRRVATDAEREAMLAQIHDCRDAILGQRPETIADMRALLAFALHFAGQDPGVYADEITEALRILDERLAEMRS
jgi:hypothetical protein